MKRRFCLRIPDGERKHAPQMLNAVSPVLLVEMNDGFGIAMRTIAMATGDQMFTQRR